MNKLSNLGLPVWLSAEQCDVSDLAALVERETARASVPLAAAVDQRIPVYTGDDITSKVGDPRAENALMGEWNQVLAQGAGVFVIKRAYADTTLIDDATKVLNEIIAQEKLVHDSAGDHFATAGANSRIWNSHEKLCAAAPALFARYNANPLIHLACRAWLGPQYQITAQANVVHPGGSAQVCHRDYHLGFQDREALTGFPVNVHQLSSQLTLQGAIVHSDMPLNSGPTQLLPYSQTYHAGYVAAHLPEFREYFARHHVQLPLQRGDMMFFNPALMHAAGDNHTEDIHRFANLLQVSSAFGRAMEIVDRARMCRLLYPELLAAQNSGQLTSRELRDVVAACAEAYPFPANLELSPPIDGMAPASQQQIMQRALDENLPAARFNELLDTFQQQQRSH